YLSSTSSRRPSTFTCFPYTTLFRSVCVEPTYFKNTENYVNQKQWIQFWKKAMKLDYDPNVKVQMIRPKNKYKSDIQSAIDETAKYPVKDTDFMTDDEEKNLKRL